MVVKIVSALWPHTDNTWIGPRLYHNQKDVSNQFWT